MPQKIRMWEVTKNNTLAELQTSEISLEEQLENWLESDISILDDDLLIIGRQVRTDFGGLIDLLCVDQNGDLVVIELKKGRTPREVAAQALDYASWVKNLDNVRIDKLASDYAKLGGSSFKDAFESKFETDLPEVLNTRHRTLIVAEYMDDSTERIVRYLADEGVQINVATLQHFKDSGNRELLAQVYLIEPEEAEAKAVSSSSSRRRKSLNELDAAAVENGLGELYRSIGEGVQDTFEARGTNSINVNYVRYRAKLKSGKNRTVLYVYADAQEGYRGVYFEIHGTWLSEFLGIELETLKSWLPPNLEELDASKWPGARTNEKQGAIGFGGSFRNSSEVERFIAGIKENHL